MYGILRNLAITHRYVVVRSTTLALILVHTHTEDLSFVLYLDVPKELEEENKNERNNDQYGGPGAITFMWGEGSTNDVIVANNRLPKTGEFYIFPTHLRHMVYPFKSDVIRISMSGNLGYVNDSI